MNTAIQQQHHHKRRPTNRGAHPPMPAFGAHITYENITVFKALENDATLSRLIQMVSAANRCDRSANTPQTQALTVAKWAIAAASGAEYRRAKEIGQLLFCWHGTSLCAPLKPQAPATANAATPQPAKEGTAA